MGYFSRKMHRTGLLFTDSMETLKTVEKEWLCGGRRGTSAEGLEGGSLKFGRSGVRFHISVLLGMLPNSIYKMKRMDSNSLKDFIK